MTILGDNYSEDNTSDNVSARQSVVLAIVLAARFCTGVVNEARSQSSLALHNGSCSGFEGSQ